MNVSSEGILIGSDATEVVWFAEVTEAMVAGLKNARVSELIDELNDAVASICETYGVE